MKLSVVQTLSGQWARENGCEWDEDTCVGAARGGHVHVLEWCYEQGCANWNARTCRAAAIAGQLDVLKWVEARSLPWSKAECRKMAVELRHPQLVKWIDSIDGAPVQDDDVLNT
eukprot:SAG31_NODE_4482_length_3197_cov_2.463202_5_plen_114_part_00